MGKISLLLVVGFVLAVTAYPYENARDAVEQSRAVQYKLPYGNNPAFVSESLSRDYLIQLYERLLQIQPARRPQQQPAEEIQPDENLTEDKIPTDQLDIEPQPEPEDAFGKPQPIEGDSNQDKTQGKQDQQEQEQKPGAPDSPEELVPPSDADLNEVEKGENNPVPDKAQENTNDVPKQKDQEKRPTTQKPNVPPKDSKPNGHLEEPKTEGNANERKNKPPTNQGQDPANVPKKPEGHPAPLVQINVNVAAPVA